jgi:hypothetical protein
VTTLHWSQLISPGISIELVIALWGERMWLKFLCRSYIWQMVVEHSVHDCEQNSDDLNIQRFMVTAEWGAPSLFAARGLSHRDSVSSLSLGRDVPVLRKFLTCIQLWKRPCGL